MPQATLSFADLLAPVSPETFVAEYLGRKPLHIPGAADKFAGVMSWESLSTILGMNALWTGRTLQLVLDTRLLQPDEYCVPGVDREGRQVPMADMAKVRSWLRRGASLVCNDIDSLTPGLREAATALESALGGKAQANLYCSWKAHQAFGSHFDTHDVFALHIAGEKTWNIYGRPIQDPIAHPAFKNFGQAYHDANRGPVSMTVTLRPGDLLYLPRGWYHDAMASSEATIHVAFGVTRPIGLDFVGMLYEAAVSEDLIRRNPPSPDANGGEDFRAYLAEVGDRLAALARAPEVVGRFGQFCRGFRYDRTGVTLPDDALVREYRVMPGLSLSLAGGRWVLGDGKRGVAVPPGTEAPVRWVLDRQGFTEAEFRDAFPALGREGCRKLLDDLTAMKVVALH